MINDQNLQLSEINKEDIGLAELMSMVENGLTPPGIKVYDDMPSDEKQEASKSLLTKTTKVIYNSNVSHG